MTMGASLTVLLVDDEQQILLSSETLLRYAGVRKIKTVDDSRNVLPLLKKEKIFVSKERKPKNIGG